MTSVTEAIFCSENRANQRLRTPSLEITRIPSMDRPVTIESRLGAYCVDENPLPSGDIRKELSLLFSTLFCMDLCAGNPPLFWTTYENNSARKTFTLFFSLKPPNEKRYYFSFVSLEDGVEVSSSLNAPRRCLMASVIPRANSGILRDPNKSTKITAIITSSFVPKPNISV